MKKLLSALIFVAILASSLVGCGEEKTSQIESEEISVEAQVSVQQSLDVDVSNELFEQSIEISKEEPPEESSEESSEEITFVSNAKDGFYVKYTEGEVDFDDAPKALIDVYKWGKEYTPEAWGQVIYKKDDAIYVKLTCVEKDPLTVVEEIGGSVFRDSCLEFFFDPFPNRLGKRQFNLEMNSKGVYLFNYTNDYNAGAVSNYSSSAIETKGEVFDTYWTVTARIPLQILTDIYGEVPEKGDTIACNFNKCGSGTATPHYGSWVELEGDTPYFHQPQNFGKVVIA